MRGKNGEGESEKEREKKQGRTGFLARSCQRFLPESSTAVLVCVCDVDVLCEEEARSQSPARRDNIDESVNAPRECDESVVERRGLLGSLPCCLTARRGRQSRGLSSEG